MTISRLLKCAFWCVASNNLFGVEMPMFLLGLFLLHLFVFAVIQPSVIAVSAQPQSSCSTVYECICANTTKDVYSFNGLAHCDNGDKMVNVGILTCITFEDKLGFLVAASCPFSSRLLSSTSHRNSYSLSYNLSVTSNFNTDVMCRPMNRTGRNCGKCVDGTAVVINSYFLQCVPREECHWYNWFLVLLADLGPVTILFIIIVVLHIRFTSGYANLYILYAQLITMQLNVIISEEHWISLTSDSSIASSIVIPLISVYSIWSLDLGRCIAPDVCTNHHFSNYLYPFLLQYIIAVYGLVLIITVYVLVELHAHNVRLVVWLWHPFRMCFARFQRQLNVKTSLVDAFATFLLLSYSKFALTSIMLLTPTKLFNRTGSVVDHVLLYDGTVDYFGTEHLPLAVVAIIVVIIFVILPPLAMILYPFKCVQRCLTRYRLHRPALVAFMDAFQGCYKDGTNGTRDLRFFSAVYWFVRIILFFIYRFLVRNDEYPLLKLILFFIIFFTSLLVLIFKPYKRNIYNYYDIAMLSCLFLLTCATMYRWVKVVLRAEPSLKYEIFLYILLLVPFLIAVGYVLVCLCTFVGRKCHIQQLAWSGNHTMRGYFTTTFLRDIPPVVSTNSDDLPDRLITPERYSHDKVNHAAARSYGAL